jgi:carbamoyltransferase
LNILGISAFYHDSAAVLVCDGDVIAAAQEERFTRKKHDANFPLQAIEYCLKEGGLILSDIDYIAFYDKPSTKFDRLLKTYLSYAPQGLSSFLTSMPSWVSDKIFGRKLIHKELRKLSFESRSKFPPIIFMHHHHSHAASAFFPSPFQQAAVLCLDGVGEWATTSVWLGDGNRLFPKWQINFPHSLGLLYAAFTYYTGFKVNSGEYKVMGLAPYGEPKYTQLIYDHLIDLKEDGTFRLDMKYFNYTTGLTMTNKKFHDLFGAPPREPESQITQRDMDLACSIQEVTEEAVLRLARTVRQEMDVEYLCLAGGVALNCVANGKIYKEGIFKDLWIQPAAGDAGGALGAAFAVWYEYKNKHRPYRKGDTMKGTLLGPKFTNKSIGEKLDKIGAIYTFIEDEALLPKIAELIANEKVVGWFQGRMEFGPRALGARSILGDPRSSEMQSMMNLKIKYRESFRPFAPAVIFEDVSSYFEIENHSPYMLLVAEIKQSLRNEITKEERMLFGIEKLKAPRSSIPAITHVDYSARVQTVDGKSNPRFYELLNNFKKLTGCSVLVNTSFNIRGEPIVCSPEEAYQCFMRTEMDYLVLENYLLTKSKQPESLREQLDISVFEPD